MKCISVDASLYALHLRNSLFCYVEEGMFFQRKGEMKRMTYKRFRPLLRSHGVGSISNPWRRRGEATARLPEGVTDTCCVAAAVIARLVLTNVVAFIPLFVLFPV